MPDQLTHLPSSYRDPSGFMFKKEDLLYRQVNKVFKEDFDLFISGGLYASLVKKELLIPHEDMENMKGTGDAYKILRPSPIAFISYPWEWTFDMLKDAALLTLQLLREGMQAGMILKDATPFNIQWHKGKLIFIDTLSFEKYNEEEPWIAYRQFCETFLGPLLLMHYSKKPLHPLLLAYPDGIPLAVTKSLLPRRSRFSLHTYLHIHLHASISGKKQSPEKRKIKFSRQKLVNLVSSLETLVQKLKLPEQDSTWSDYYTEAAQRDDYLEQKKKMIQSWLDELPAIKTAADFGANDGTFTRLLSAKNIVSLATDFDPYCINRLYNEIKLNGGEFIQPLIVDLANPSPAIGVNNKERESLLDRTNRDLALALAIIHHLAIGKNIPFTLIAAFFHQVCHTLIIEFVPKEDEKVQVMLNGRKDIYTEYTLGNFETDFKKYFTIQKKESIPGSGRVLYLMIKHEN